jgi:galactokinase/mevalonate kinase-like predicted kinase
MGSGGGGLFLFFVPGNRQKFKELMRKEGLTEMPFSFDFEGSKTLLNFHQHTNGK